MTRFDFVIFGATGFTGKCTIPQVEKLSKENGRNYTWAIAGRSETKLKAVLKEIGEQIGKDLKSTPIIIADVSDPMSLENMAKQTKVLINTCGPYIFYGEPVIKACIQHGAHHLDISGEPYYMEEMQLKYHEAAQESGVYVISACGFDSIPADIGLVYLESIFDGTLNSVETYLSAKEIGGPRPGPTLNYGTWESAVQGIEGISQLRELRSRLFPTKLPDFRPKLSNRGPVHTCPYNRKWALPFMGSDQSVMQRTQRYMYEAEKKRPVQVETYFCVGSFMSVVSMAIMGGIFMTLARFNCGRKLLLKHPRFFSLGYFGRGNPSQEKVESIQFEIILIGQGWSSRQSHGDAEFTTRPDKKVIARVSGVNPGYGATCITLAISALTLLEEPDKLPKKGGVYSAGAAFYHTGIVKKFHENGLKFEEICDK